MLEVIDKGEPTETHPVPLLFVHGAGHAAWCWDEHFLDYFAARGYRAVALSLRGHGASPDSAPARYRSIADYVSDVAEVADQLPRTPIVIGTSMGGFVVQTYLQSHPAPAAVLVASAPPRGGGAAFARTAMSMLRTTTRHVWQTAKSTLVGGPSPKGGNTGWIRELMFSPHTPNSLVAHYAERIKGEQMGKFALDVWFLNLPNPQLVQTPMLVLGGEDDRSVTPREVHATARAYRTEAVIFPKMGHDMMIEPGWADVAEGIDTWLSSQHL